MAAGQLEKRIGFRELNWSGVCEQPRSVVRAWKVKVVVISHETMASNFLFSLPFGVVCLINIITTESLA
jgi:hypothetical protein